MIQLKEEQEREKKIAGGSCCVSFVHIRVIMEKHEICVCGCFSFNNGGFHPLYLVVLLPLSYNATLVSVIFQDGPCQDKKRGCRAGCPFRCP